MHIYLVEHQVVGSNCWKLKQKFATLKEAVNLYQVMLNNNNKSRFFTDWGFLELAYRVVRLV